MSFMLPRAQADDPVTALPSATGGRETVTEYRLKDTEVRTVRAKALQRDYQVFVSLPPSYALKPDHRYPVLFVTDANYSFPLIRSIAARMGDHGKGLEEFVLVGLSYAVGDTPEYSRRRDYTPTAAASASEVSDMPGRKPVFGEAEAYRAFVETEVFAAVAQQYRVDMARKIFAGHSYGALFGAHILLTKPTMFERYILSSPSFWYDGKVMLQRAREYVATHDDLPAQVFFAVGGFETIKPGSTDSRYNTTRDLVRDQQRFAQIVTAPRYPNLRLVSSVLADEDHLSVNPVALSRGLIWALPGKR